MDYKVTFAAQSQRDLFAIVSFLAEKNPVAARKLGDSLLDAALSLAQLPRRGVAVRARPGLRRLAHPPYHWIFYRVDETRRLVEVVRFWDGRQDPALSAGDGERGHGCLRQNGNARFRFLHSEMGTNRHSAICPLFRLAGLA